MGEMRRKPAIDLNRASWRARTGVDRGLGGGARKSTGRGATTGAVGAHGWPCSQSYHSAVQFGQKSWDLCCYPGKPLSKHGGSLPDSRAPEASFPACREVGYRN